MLFWDSFFYPAFPKRILIRGFLERCFAELWPSKEHHSVWDEAQAPQGFPAHASFPLGKRNETSKKACQAQQSGSQPCSVPPLWVNSSWCKHLQGSDTGTMKVPEWEHGTLGSQAYCPQRAHIKNYQGEGKGLKKDRPGVGGAYL